MKNRSLVSGFRLTVTWVAAASILATLFTWLAAAVFYKQAEYKSIYPANYYEQQIPEIDANIRRENAALLSASGQEMIENAISGNGITYQVVDSSGGVLYGTNTEPVFTSESDLINRLNTTTVHDKNSYIHVVPITGADGKVIGAVSLFYRLKLSYGNGGGQWLVIALAAALCSPFFYIILFTLIFTKMFVKQINRPLQLLMDAAGKIKERDLDFEIQYHSENELGKLCVAFSEMQNELKQSLFAQWQMEQARVEMVEALAHDLKTPISVVLGYTESLLDSKENNRERLHKYLLVIEENAQKCSALIHQMQTSSELETGDTTLQLVQVYLPDFLAQKITHYELQAKEKNIDIELHLRGNIEILYRIDIDKLGRIFDNLISNSLRHTPDKGKISIVANAEKERIVYQICDTGSGFSQKDMQKAFDRFYRGDKARQTGTGHSGLGLSIVKQLVEQLGGEVKIENNKNGGACITFWNKIL